MSRIAKTDVLALQQLVLPRTAAPSLWVAFGLAMGSVVSVGLARFAYSLLLIPMQADLHWSYAQAGTLNAAISIGYLLGAIPTPRLERAFGSKCVFIGAMLFATLGLFATSMFRSYDALLALRFVTGLALGPIFICGFGLAANAGAASNRSTLFTSVYVAGLGLGIVLSGMLLPPLLVAADHWPMGWAALGATALVATLIAMPAVWKSPSAFIAANTATRSPLRGLAPLMFAIFVYGAGYFALVTFVIAYLRASGYGAARILDFWITAGMVLMVSMFFWGKVLERFRGGWGVALTTGILIASVLTLLAWHGEAAVVLSSILFGASILVSGFSHWDYGRRLTDRQDWIRVTAALTTAFSLGLVLGPILCGWIADVAGLRAGLLMSAGLLLVCIAAVLRQRPVSRQEAMAPRRTSSP